MWPLVQTFVSYLVASHRISCAMLDGRRVAAGLRHRLDHHLVFDLDAPQPYLYPI
jgi:hypothetical protein